MAFSVEPEREVDAGLFVILRLSRQNFKAVLRNSSYCLSYTAVPVTFFPCESVWVTCTVRVLPSAEIVMRALRTALPQLGVIQHALDAEQSDLYDVLAYIAFALPRITRQERAEKARPSIRATFAEKQRAFLEFVLTHYIAEGFEELDQDKLAPLLQLRYNAISDAILDLGPAAEIVKMFAGFQQYLYSGAPADPDRKS